MSRFSVAGRAFSRFSNATSKPNIGLRSFQTATATPFPSVASSAAPPKYINNARSNTLKTGVSSAL